MFCLLPALVPQVINRNGRGESFAITPQKASAVTTFVDRFSPSAGGGGWYDTRFGKLISGEENESGLLAHCRHQVIRDSSAVAGIGKHHPLLHGACIIPAHETNQAVVAVLAACRMSDVHGFALDKKRIELRNDKARLALIVAESETEIGRLC